MSRSRGYMGDNGLYLYMAVAQKFACTKKYLYLLHKSREWKNLTVRYPSVSILITIHKKYAQNK